MEDSGQAALCLWYVQHAQPVRTVRRLRGVHVSTREGCGRLRRTSNRSTWCLHGQRRWNRRLWRRLARAPEAVAGRPVARPLALGASDQSGTLTMLWCTRRRRPCAGSSGPAPSHRRRRRARRGRQRGRALRSAVAASRSQRRCRRCRGGGYKHDGTTHTNKARWGLNERRDSAKRTRQGADRAW